MLYFLFFILELGVLFLLSKKLIKSLSHLLYRFSRSHKFVVSVLAVLFLPGTIMHELAHMFMAGILLIPVGELSVVPEIEGDSVKLGSVQVGKSDPFRMTLVGVAPVILGVLCILGILYLIQGSSEFILWQVILGLILIFQIGNSMFSSKKDLEGVIWFLLLIFILVLIIFVSVYLLNSSWISNFLEYLKSIDYSGISNFFQKAIGNLFIPIALDLIIIFLTKPFIRRN